MLGIGIPFALYEASSNNKFGYYARTLVDLDFAEYLANFIIVER